jgi:hypothetical protein
MDVFNVVRLVTRRAVSALALSGAAASRCVDDARPVFVPRHLQSLSLDLISTT